MLTAVTKGTSLMKSTFNVTNAIIHVTLAMVKETLSAIIAQMVTSCKTASVSHTVQEV